MTAKEMFEEHRYRMAPFIEGKYKVLSYYKLNSYSTDSITFMLDEKKVLSHRVKCGEAVGYAIKIPSDLNEAIHQQMLELGWLE